ncbi:MAG: carbohydrate kinase family protein [Candidatus Peribacteraceae bacterium]|nr:carbohydrate kinase family protein [Candidatus Peribacteraceae bacterium]
MAPTPRPRTLSIGGATIDVFVRADRDLVASTDDGDAFVFPLGAKVRVREVKETCGGGASNTSVGLARLGCDAAFCGVVGSDQWGLRLLENMRREEVDTRRATIVEGEVSSFSIILSATSGERVILYEPGTNAHLQDAVFDREALGGVQRVYLNSLQESSRIIEDDIVAALNAPQAPLLTWNPGNPQIRASMHDQMNAALLKRTDLLLVNDEEALIFTGEKMMEAALRSLLKTGVHTVCITEGAKGVTASDGTHLYHCPSISSAQVLETTGAGDAFGTGVTWALLHAMDLPTALKAGTMNATSVVGAIGAQAGLLTDTEMRVRVKSMQLPVSVRPLDS